MVDRCSVGLSHDNLEIHNTVFCAGVAMSVIVFNNGQRVIASVFHKLGIQSVGVHAMKAYNKMDHEHARQIVHCARQLEKKKRAAAIHKMQRLLRSGHDGP